MSDETLCLSFLFTCVFLPIVGMWAFSWLSGNRNTPAGTYPPQRTVESIARSYDPTGVMASQRTDYGEINETARVADDHVNGHGAGVTGNINVFENDLKDPTTAAHIASLQRTQGKGENTYKLVFRKGNRP